MYNPDSTFGVGIFTIDSGGKRKTGGLLMFTIARMVIKKGRLPM
jgi:hypothetical protein